MIRRKANECNWSRAEVRAEVVRRGSSLRRVALKAGLSESACRMALQYGNCPAGEKALAAFIGVAPRVIWPDRYRADGTRLRARDRVNQREESAA